MSPDPITSAAGVGLGELANYGLAGILLMILLASGAWLVRYFATSVRDCHAQTKTALDKNTEAFIDLKTTLAKIEGLLRQ